MSLVTGSSAAQQNKRVGVGETPLRRRLRRQRRTLGEWGLAAEIDRGWRHFWSRRGGAPALPVMGAQR
jgi:hypothetical protein